MKLAGIVAAAAGAAGAIMFAATSATQVSAASTSQPPCIPKITSVKGHTEVDYCGPATATVKVGSKTYNFKDGYCGMDPKNKIVVQLVIGVISQIKSPVNDGKPLFQLSALKADSLSIDTVTADWNGKQLDTVGTVNLKGSIPSSGTFTSKGFSSHFSGSWNCHGVVVTTP
jgi:hypothetical protein